MTQSYPWDVRKSEKGEVSRKMFLVTKKNQKVKTPFWGTVVSSVLSSFFKTLPCIFSFLCLFLFHGSLASEKNKTKQKSHLILQFFSLGQEEKKGYVRITSELIKLVLKIWHFITVTEYYLQTFSYLKVYYLRGAKMGHRAAWWDLTSHILQLVHPTVYMRSCKPKKN